MSQESQNGSGQADEIRSQFSEAHLRVVLEVVRDHLMAQMNQLDALDAKIGNMFGFASAITAIVLSFLALNPDSLNLPVLLLIILGTVVYLAIAVLCLRALIVRNWHGGPDIQDLWNRLQTNLHISGLLHQVAYELSEAYEDNVGSVRTKQTTVNLLVFALLIELCFYVPAIVVAIFISST